jgi:hypothetical protein
VYSVDFTVNCRLLSVYRRLFPLIVQLAWYGILYLRVSRIVKYELVTSQWMSWAMSKNLKVEQVVKRVEKRRSFLLSTTFAGPAALDDIKAI